MQSIRVIALILSLTAGLTLRAQLYQSEYHCDSTQEYGPGFTIEAGKLFPQQNINVQYNFRFKAGNDHPQALLVFEVKDGTNCTYWQGYPLEGFVNDTAEWSTVSIHQNFPFDYIGKGNINTYIWNRNRENLWFEEARLDYKAFNAPKYYPVVELQQLTPIVEYINAQGDTVNNPSIVECNIEWGSTVKTETRFKEDVKLLRLAFGMPLPEGDIIVYRRNQHIDSTHLQASYYLDREGFTIQNDSFGLATYHNTGISSLQLDTEGRVAYFNIDYWRDHPLLHYPMLSDTTDYFQDISYRNVKAGEVLKGEFNLYWCNPAYWGVPEELPRIMPIWDGYQSAFIFTEHADWTDIRTHRAVLFGNENITNPKDAVGGFCYYNIPVTKSVFYWNPDNVTNEKTSNGNFTGLHATIKTDKDFLSLLNVLKKNGCEICLHTPEQYTTIPTEFPKAMRFMRRHFRTKSWIDHGYNNAPENNREDLVCDGLLPDSPQYAAGLWRKNGVRYLWNAYYEENRMEEFLFDGHFVQPYDGFGDALPNRQITTLPNGDRDFLLWSTPSTLEVNEDNDWYYFFETKRLQRLVDNHNVFITHTYPAWTDPWRAFWQYNDNGTAVAMPGFNFALSQLAQFREEKKILPTTVEQYLDYYEKLLNVDYTIISSDLIGLHNRGDEIKGFTLLCSRPITVEDKTIDYRKVEEGYLVWFNLKKNESLLIKIR